MDTRWLWSEVIAMGLFAALIGTAYAVARLTATLFPPSDGRPSKVVVVVTALCLIAIVVLAVLMVGVAANALGFLG